MGADGRRRMGRSDDSGLGRRSSQGRSLRRMGRRSLRILGLEIRRASLLRDLNRNISNTIKNQYLMSETLNDEYEIVDVFFRLKIKMFFTVFVNISKKQAKSY